MCGNSERKLPQTDTHIFESAPKTSSATVAKCGRGWRGGEATLVYPQDAAAATCSMSTHAIAVWIFFIEKVEQKTC